jgi:hypothetical protein
MATTTCRFCCDGLMAVVMGSGSLALAARCDGQSENDDESDSGGGSNGAFEPCGEVSEGEAAGDARDDEGDRPPADGGGDGSMLFPVLQVWPEQLGVQECSVESG